MKCIGNESEMYPICVFTSRLTPEFFLQNQCMPSYFITKISPLNRTVWLTTGGSVEELVAANNKRNKKASHYQHSPHKGPVSAAMSCPYHAVTSFSLFQIMLSWITWSKCHPSLDDCPVTIPANLHLLDALWERINLKDHSHCVIFVYIVTWPFIRIRRIVSFPVNSLRPRYQYTCVTKLRRYWFR